MSKQIFIDIREESAYQNSHIPGAISMHADTLRTNTPPFSKEDEVIFYCAKGEESEEIAAFFRDLGHQAKSLDGGYLAWLVTQMTKDKSADIERSIRKKFHKTVFSQFTRAVKEYQLVEAGDKIAVCISGGKDSMLMAKLFQELQKHRQVPFTLEFLVMDPGYAPENRRLIEQNAKAMGIPITVFETDIFAQVFTAPKNACYLCAKMRRGHLYSEAKARGCNKIALGHHFDDVIETTLMSMLWGGQIQTMLPKLNSTNFEGMQLIRPLYLVREADIKHFAKYHELHFLQCACKFTDTCSLDGSMQSKRTEMKALIQTMQKDNPNVVHSIFRSMENVHLDAVLGYKKNGERHWFLDP